jgi:hypothetical protein
MAVDDATHGSTDPAVGAHTYNAGEVVTITAIPASGWYFASWSGDVANTSAASTTVTMNGNKTVTANFTTVATYYTLTMLVDDATHGSTDPAVGVHTHNAGQVVTVTATPASGWYFASWSGDVANTSAASTTVTMDGNKTVTAYFIRSNASISYVLTMSFSGGGTTDPAVGAHTYDAGQVVSIAPTPAYGYYFAGWSGDVADNTSATTTVTMNGNKTVMANFTTSVPPNILTVTTSGATNVSGSSAGLNGYLASLAGAPSVQVSFQWGLTESYGNETTAQAMIVTGAFYFDLGGLTPGTTYCYRAKAVGNGRTAYGAKSGFTTGAWSVMSSGTTDSLQGIWGSSSTDVFAVGTSGTILHYNGSTWSSMTSGTTNALNGVWGSSPSDVFAVGSNGAILHYNGSWSPMTSGITNELRGVWGSSASDVFAVGTSGIILHYNGSAWSALTSGTTNNLYGVWGSSASDVFAVGGYYDGFSGGVYHGIILHYNGSTWSTLTSNPGSQLNGVWGSSASDVFAVGYGGTILHYDGSSWSALSSAGGYLCGVWGSSASDVFAVGWNGTIHYNGSIWSAMSSGTTDYLLGVWGSSATDVFAVGKAGTMLHYGRVGESASAAITTVNPNQGTRGQPLSLTVTGTNLAGATVVSFGSGITVNAFTVDSSTQITVSITIGASASLGSRDVSIITPSGTVTKANGFTVA